MKQVFQAQAGKRNILESFLKTKQVTNWKVWRKGKYGTQKT